MFPWAEQVTSSSSYPSGAFTLVAWGAAQADGGAEVRLEMRRATWVPTPAPAWAPPTPLVPWSQLRQSGCFKTTCYYILKETKKKINIERARSITIGQGEEHRFWWSPRSAGPRGSSPHHPWLASPVLQRLGAGSQSQPSLVEPTVTVTATPRPHP